MPLIKRYIDNGSEIIVWKITEQESYFSQKLQLDFDIHRENFTKKRMIEWLLPRFIISTFYDIDTSLYQKDEFGKPYIEQNPFYISISHSHDYFTFIKSPVLCGIDLQCFNQKISRIAHKFVNEEEEDWLGNNDDRLLPLHLIWSAKEAIYKAYGRRKISFKANIYVPKSILSKRSYSKLILDQEEQVYSTINLTDKEYSLIYATKSN